MLIAHVTFKTIAADRQTAITTLLDEAQVVRSLPGCLHFAPLADPADPCQTALVQEWADEAAFNAYTATPGFARTGAILRPMMTAAPISRRFTATLLATVA